VFFGKTFTGFFDFAVGPSAHPPALAMPKLGQAAANLAMLLPVNVLPKNAQPSGAARPD
jgi:hypothetical protein